MSKSWELAFVLPNLVLPAPSADEPGDGSAGVWSRGISLGQESISIVSGQDSRAKGVSRRSPGARKLLAGFRDLANKPYRPAVLMVRQDAPQQLHHDLGAAVAFRNAAAFSFLLRARATAIYQGSSVDPSWSDTFDFHPTVIGRQGHLITHTEALRAVFSKDPACGPVLPYVWRGIAYTAMVLVAVAACSPNVIPPAALDDPSCALRPSRHAS